MSATPWLRRSVPSSSLLKLRNKTRSKLDLKEMLTRNLGGVFPRVVAVQDLGTPMPESLFSSKPMMNISDK